MPEEATGKTGVPSERRQKPERPRDELGRPLAHDAVNLLHLPDFDSFPMEENDRLGRDLLRQRNYFGAHEAWETAWKQARTTDEAELFKGLSQMGAGFVHLFRGNAHGAVTLLRRAAGRVGRYPNGTRGVSTEKLAARLESDARRIETGELTPGADATVDPLDV